MGQPFMTSNFLCCMSLRWMPCSIPGLTMAMLIHCSLGVACFSTWHRVMWRDMPHLSYSVFVWGKAYTGNFKLLFVVQKAFQIITNFFDILIHMAWLEILKSNKLYDYDAGVFMLKCVHSSQNNYMSMSMSVLIQQVNIHMATTDIRWILVSH